MSTYRKDPDAKLDFHNDWSAWLAGDTIATSAWVVPVGITQTTPAPSNTNTSTTIWLMGGTAGQVYAIKNTITTAGGRTDERTFYVYVNEPVIAGYSYNHDPSGIPLDYVRDRIGDTDSSQWLLSDSEINAEINSQPSLIWAAAACAQKIANRFARNVSAKIGNDSETLSDLFKHYSNMVASLTAEARAMPTSAGVSVGQMKAVIQPRTAIIQTRLDDVKIFEKI